MLRYTKGSVINEEGMTAEEYQVKIFGGKKFLFVQHKLGDYFYSRMTLHWYVFEQRKKQYEKIFGFTDCNIDAYISVWQ